MKSKYIVTYFYLPPSPPSAGTFRQLVHLIFEEYGWFRPERYGRAVMNGRLSPERTDFDALVSYYEDYQNITIATRSEKEFVMLFPARKGDHPFVGVFTWTTSVSEAKQPAWQETHVRQTVGVMRLLNSYLAQTGPTDDWRRKARRLVPNPDGVGSTQVHTVRDPSEGLAGLYWRNFFGAPFVSMFGDRILSLPPGTRRELSDDLVLVQPYELPTQAMTPEGDAAEERLITVLGPECFYDHAHHRKPTRAPELPGAR